MRLLPKKSQRAETEIHPPKAGISSIKTGIFPFTGRDNKEADLS